MEDIEYLDEYKDLVLPGIKVEDGRPTPASAAGAARRRRISSDSTNSSSIDADIFQKLFHGKIIDDELFYASGPKSQVRRHLTSSSSDESNDDLDSLDDLGEALMRPYQSSVAKPSTSRAAARKSQSSSNSSSSSSLFEKANAKTSTSKPLSSGASSSKAIPKNKNPSSGSHPGSVNGSSGNNKAVTIIKAQKTDLRPPNHEPKTDPLNLLEFSGESDSDSSYEYESDFYGDRDSEDEDAEPVIDISTDTSRTTSVADTVTPVVSDDDGPDPDPDPGQNEQSEKERDAHEPSSILSSVDERLQSYLIGNLNCAEAPPIYTKQSSARKTRSNEKKHSSSFEQVKHDIERAAASPKEGEEKREQKLPEQDTAPSGSSSVSRKLYDIDDGLTLETLERMSLDLAEQILEIDVERSYEYQKRSGSKPRRVSRSKRSAEPSTATSCTLDKSHVRKLTYSSERLNEYERSAGNKLRRAKSESAFSKRGRSSRGRHQRKNRAATTEEKMPSGRDEGLRLKKKRGRPRKNIPKDDMDNKKDDDAFEVPVETGEGKMGGFFTETSPIKEDKEQTKEEEQQAPEESEELNKTKELSEFTTLSKDDISMTTSHHATDLKSSSDNDIQPDEESASSLDNEPPTTPDTSNQSFDTAKDIQEVTDIKIYSDRLKDKESSMEIEEEIQTEILPEVFNDKDISEEMPLKLDDDVDKIVMADAMEVCANVEAIEVTETMHEVTDSQLAEDIKLAEEILAAEVGKGMEPSEISTALVQGQDHVTEIVKELEQETIVEAFEMPAEEQPPEGQLINEEKSQADESSAEESSPKEEHYPAKPQPVFEEEPELSPNRKLNLYSPTISTKKSERAFRLKTSASPQPEISPRNERESRSTRSLKSDLTLISDEPSRRISPRMGRSPAESHSPQERSPVDKKAITCELAAEKTSKKLCKNEIDHAEEKIAQIKGDEDLQADKQLNPNETDTEILDVEKPLKKRRSRKTQGTDINIATPEREGSFADNKEDAKLVKETPAAEVDQLIDSKVPQIIDSDEPQPKVEIEVVIEEKLPTSETETKKVKENPIKLKQTRRGADKKIIEMQSIILDSSQASDMATDNYRKKPTNARKSRREKKDVERPESDIPTEHTDSEREKNPSRASSKGMDAPSDKEDRSSGRVSRRDKTILDVATCLKENTSSTKTQPSSEDATHSQNKPQTKDRSSQDSEPAKRRQSSKRRNDISRSEEKKSHDTDIDKKYPHPEKGPKKSRSRNVKLKPETKLEAENPIPSSVEPDAAQKDNIQEKIQDNTNKDTKPKYEDTKPEEAPILKVKTETVEQIISADMDPVDPSPGKIRLRRHPVSTEEPENYVPPVSHSISHEPSPLAEEPESSFSNRKIPTKTYLKNKRHRPETPRADESPEKEPIPPITLDKTLESALNLCETKISLPSKPSKRRKRNSRLLHYELSTDIDSDKVESDFNSETMYAETFTKSLGRTSPERFPPKSESVEPIESDSAAKSLSLSNQQAVSTPSTQSSCRQLRVLIKRTPTTSGARGRGSRKYAFSKRKRFRKILANVAEAPPPDQTFHDPDKPLVKSQPECDSIPESKQKPTEQVPKKGIKQATLEIQGTLNDKQKADGEQRGRKKITDKEIHATKESTEEILKEEKSTETEEEAKSEVPDLRTKEVQRENESLNDEISPAKESSKQEACVAKLAPEEESFSIKETPTDPVAVSLKDVPETTPIPESTETIGVTIEPEPESESEASTSSAVKRSLRKREADSSQPDEAAKGKQLQVRDKPGTAKQDQAKSVRRRNLQEAEERPANKRSKFDSDENEKFISYISNETILSSTEAPLKEKKSDPGKSPLPARKPATGKYRHSETNKQIIISATAGKKAMDKSPEGPSPSSKKPMVQTILNANLNLRKPAETEPSPPPAKKSLSKAEILSRETKFHSSVVLKKKTLQASGKTELTKDDAASTASRKVNISVSVMQSDKSTEDTPHSSMASPTLSKKAQQAAQKLTRKLEVKNKMMAKIKKLGPVNPLPRRAEASNELAKTEDPFADTARKADVAKKIEARKSEGSAPARKALPSGVANKKIEDRKSEGASLIAGMTKNLAKKLETRKSEAASLGLSARKLLFQTDTGKKSESKKFDGGPKAAKPVEIAKKAEAEGIGTASVKAREGVKKAKTKMAIPKAGLHSSDAETSSMSRDSSREDPARSSVIEKTAPSSASRAGFATLSMHMTRAASSTRSLAGTPTPGTDKQVNSSKEPSKGTGTLRQTIRGRPRGGRSRQMPLGGLKRKIDDATEATDSKRPRELPQEEKQQQLEEQQQLDKQQQLEMQQKLEMQKHLEKQQQLEKGPVRETAPVAFPVKITAAGSEPLPDSLVMPKAVPSQKAKVRNLCVKVNRLTVRKYLTGNPEKLLAGSQKLQPNRKPEIASDTDSAAESMPELMLERLHSGFRIPMLLSKALPGPGTPIASPLFADQPSAAAASSLASAPNPHRNAAPTPKVAPPAPTKASQSQTIDAKAIAKTASALAAAENHIHNKTILLNKAQKLGAQGKEQMVTTKTMPLPVPILVMEVKTEPEDAPPAEPAVIDTLPKAAESPAATLEKSIQPIPTPSPQAMASSSEVIRLIAPAVVNAPSSSSTSIPAAAASVGNANSFGHTKMFSFLYPNRYQRSYGEVGLDFCCPNLEGPMRAIDPTRLHAKAEVPVLEMPQCLVITTKFISKADKNIPNKVRAKLDMLNKDKTQDSGSETGSNETASPSAAQPIPALNLAELAAGHPDPLDSLTKHLPKGTTLTKKVLPTGVTAPGTASSSMVAHLPPSLIQLPPLCPSDKQRLELQTRVQVFDLVLQSLSRRAANLTLAERQRTIEEIVRTSTLMAIDVDVGTKLLENYVHYLNRATNTKMSLPSIRLNTVGTPAIGTPAVANITIASVPLYDADKNIIGYQSPNITTQTAVPPLDPAVTSTPNTSSAGAKLGSSKTKSPGGSQKQIFNLKTPLSMVTPAPKPKPSAKKKTMSGGTIISMNSAAQKETEGGRKTTPARTVAQSKTAPRVTPKLGAGPIPAVNASTPSSSPKTNVFIINQLAQPEECILPDSNNAVPPMEAEIKGELEDSPEVLL